MYGYLNIRSPVVGVRVVPSSDGNNHINQNRQRTFQVVRLSVAEEVSNDENRQHEEDNHKDLKVEIHILPKTPSDDDNEGSVQKGGLDGWPEAVEKGEVDLVIPTSEVRCRSEW